MLYRGSFEQILKTAKSLEPDTDRNGFLQLGCDMWEPWIYKSENYRNW